MENFLAEVHCMKYRIRWENKNFDDMGTLSSSMQGRVVQRLDNAIR